MTSRITQDSATVVSSNPIASFTPVATDETLVADSRWETHLALQAVDGKETSLVGERDKGVAHEVHEEYSSEGPPDRTGDRWTAFVDADKSQDSTLGGSSGNTGDAGPDETEQQLGEGLGKMNIEERQSNVRT